MSLFDNLKKGLYNRKVQQNETTNTTRQAMRFADAKNIGILFVATLEENRKAALAYQQEIKKLKKKVTLLGYWDAKEIPADLPFIAYGNQAIGWDKTPNAKKAPEVIEFIAQPFDLLIAYHLDECLPLEYIAGASQAKLRVAPYRAETTAPYDFMIPAKNLPSFAHLLLSALDKMNK